MFRADGMFNFPLLFGKITILERERDHLDLGLRERKREVFTRLVWVGRLTSLYLLGKMTIFKRDRDRERELLDFDLREKKRDLYIFCADWTFDFPLFIWKIRILEREREREMFAFIHFRKKKLGRERERQIMSCLAWA